MSDREMRSVQGFGDETELGMYALFIAIVDMAVPDVRMQGDA